MTRERTRSISFIIQTPIEMMPARSGIGQLVARILEVVDEDHPEAAEIEQRVDPLARQRPAFLSGAQHADDPVHGCALARAHGRRATPRPLRCRRIRTSISLSVVQETGRYCARVEMLQPRGELVGHLDLVGQRSRSSRPSPPDRRRRGRRSGFGSASAASSSRCWRRSFGPASRRARPGCRSERSWPWLISDVAAEATACCAEALSDDPPNAASIV